MANNTFYGTTTYVVRLMFDVYIQKDNSFLGTETWFFGNEEITPEIYEAQLFCSEIKASTVFRACYHTWIKDFIKKIYDANEFLMRQWDGFVHIDSICIKPSRTEQFGPTEINEV